MSEYRPDPEALLARVKEAEARAQRGKLKVFFGAAAGVGKTYAMLEAAREQRADGVDVVVGYIETHGRAETDALLAGLELLPRRPLDYRGTTLPEFDLDGALRRRPHHHPGRRARPHQCAGLPARQALAGRGRAAGRRHRRLHHRQRPARREPERRGGQDHRRRHARDRARLGVRAGRRGRADRSAARRSAAALPRRQGLPPGSGPGGAGQLLPQGQPDRPARAGAAPHRRAGGRADARLPARARDRSHLADGRAHPRVRRPQPAVDAAGAGGQADGRSGSAPNGSRPTSRRRPSSGCRRRHGTASSRRCAWPSSSVLRPSD